MKLGREWDSFGGQNVVRLSQTASAVAGSHSIGFARMNNLNGIMMVIAAMAAFTMEDMFIKHLSQFIPVGQILVLLGTGSGIIFASLALAKRQNIFARAAWQPIMIIRTLAEAVGAMCFATGLALVDLSTVAAVFQALPLVITMGAALFMNEQVGWRRWSAILVGFIGVLLIIRPGLEGFEPASLFVLASVFAIAVRDLLTRLIDSKVSSTVVSFQGCAAFTLAGVLLMWVTSSEVSSVSMSQGWMIIVATGFGMSGYYGIVVAMRVGEASAVTPFRYSRLLFSILAGMIMFNERLDMMTILGASLIIGSGLYTFLRERKMARSNGLVAA